MVIITRQRRRNKSVAENTINVSHFAQRVLKPRVFGEVSKGVAALEKSSPHTGVGVAEGFKVDYPGEWGAAGLEGVEKASNCTHDAFSGRTEGGEKRE